MPPKQPKTPKEPKQPKVPKVPKEPKPSPAQKLKNDITELLDRIVAQGQVSSPLEKHVRKNFLEKRKHVTSLTPILGVLNVISGNHGDADQPRQTIKMFREKIKVYNYFRAPPKTTYDPNSNYNFKAQFYNQKNMTDKLYGYELAATNKAFGRLAPRTYITSVDLLEICNLYPISTGDRHRDVKIQIKGFYDTMGDAFMVEQINIDQGLLQDAIKSLTAKEKELVNVMTEEYISGQVCLIITQMTREDFDKEFEPFGKRSLQDSASEQYFASRFIKFSIKDIEDEDLNFGQLIDSTNKYGPADLYDYLLFSCMAKVLLKVYKESHDKYRAKCKSPSDVLTMEKIYQICLGQEWNGTSDIILTPDLSIAFFERFKLGLEIYNVKNELVFKHHPPNGKYNSNMYPSVLRILYHDNHVEEITELKSFIQCESEGTLIQHKTLSSNFRIPGKSKLDGREFKLANSAEEIMRHLGTVVKEFVPDEDTKKFSKKEKGDKKCIYLNIVYNGNLNDLLLNHIMPYGITPLISTELCATVSGIYFPNLLSPNGVPIKISINNPCNILGYAPDMSVDTIEHYINYVKAEEKLQKIVMNKRTLSHFSLSVNRAFNEYCVNIPYGRVEMPFEKDILLDVDELTELDTLKCHMLDFNKQYASCFMESSSKYGAPVVSIFEQFHKFNYKNMVEPTLLYIVKILNNHPIYNKRCTLMFGFELLEVMKHKDQLRIEILQVLNLIWVPIKPAATFIKELFDEEKYKDMDSVFKKSIPNKTIGMCGKRLNKSKDVQLFKNEDDANLHLREYGGQLTKLGPSVFAHHRIAKKELNNGFRPIREMVLSTARLNVFKLSIDLLNAGGVIKGLKTDAIFYQGDVDVTTLPFSKLLSKGLCGARLEEDKIPPPKHVATVEKVAPALPRHLHHTFDYLERRPTSVKNEFDMGSIHQSIGDKSLIMSLGGRGKSYAAITYLIKVWGKEHVLVVTPFNSMAHNVFKKFGTKTCTFHAFIGEGQDGSHTRPYDLDSAGIKGIVFDEVLLLSHAQLTRLYFWNEELDKTYTEQEGPMNLVESDSDDEEEFFQEGGHLGLFSRKYEVIATGDPKQLEAIDDIIGNERKIAYVKRIFPNLFTLDHNWRMKTEGDRQEMNELEKSLFSVSCTKDLKAWVMRNFQDRIIKTLAEVKALGIRRGVSYFNASGEAINTAFHKDVQDPKKGNRVLDDGLTYYVSHMLVCKKRLLSGTSLLHTNYQFEIAGFTKEAMKLKDVLTGAEHLVDYALIVSNFSLPYCNTVHSSQGADIPVKYVIADWWSFGVTLNWLYTAISRATSMDDIYFLSEDLSGQKDNSTEQAIRKMVKGYVGQDKRRKRMTAVPEDFVDLEWIVEKFKAGSMCKGCGNHMTFEKGSDNKVTVNRLDNALCHVKGNCELLCKACNVRAK